MLNKIDKCFLITFIMLVVNTLLPVILIFTFVAHNLDFLFEIIFSCAVINYIFIVPILFAIQLIILIIKVLEKKKHKKDWLVIIFNLITVLFLGYIYLTLWLISLAL